MSELGQHLKEIREEKGISLEDLQRSTKIQKRYLQAIEEGRFDTLPGLFYARAFVKTYAESVGLDPEPLFEQFKKELPNPRKEAAELPSRTERTKSATTVKKRTRSGAKFSALIAVVFIIVIIVGIWLFLRSTPEPDGTAVAPQDGSTDADFSENVGTDEENDDGNEAGEGDSDTAEETDEESAGDSAENAEDSDGAEEEELETELNLIESSGITTYYELIGTEQFDVVLTFSGTSYVDIKNGKGKMFYSGQPTDGDELEYDFSAEREIEFNFGASQHVTLTLNEETVDFPIDNVHQKINIVAGDIEE